MAHDQLLEEHYPEKMRSAEGSGNAFSELFALDNKALREDLPPGSKPVKPVADVTEESARAWLQDFGSFCLFYSSWGVINSFGVFESSNIQNLLVGESASRVAWIGSLQAFLIIFGGVIAGPIFDRGHSRALIYTGGFLIVFGMMLTSLSTKYWQFILAQGLTVGLGSGCFFIPRVATLPPYFVKNRALSIGLGAAGASFGGLGHLRLEPQLGFPWATRIIAFIILAVLATRIPMVIMTPPWGAMTCRTDRRVDMSAWQEHPFAYFAVGTFLAFDGTEYFTCIFPSSPVP